ncbi:MAG TPA: hypothetical protein VGQ07_01135 [Nitrospirales bacterium]|jgi:hypothetical protein|nr:hypothetical protein [Nitrospirales bacterium]
MPRDGKSALPPTASAAEAAPADAETTESTFTILQSLVTITLSYQLLFSPHSVYPMEVLEFVIVGLLAIGMLVMVMPQNMWKTRSVVWGLIVGNTILCANIFYMVGLAEPGLYITLVLFIPLAAVAPSANLYFVMSVGICAMYGIIWYELYGQYEPLSGGNLLQFPVLLVMANFYWYILGMRGMAQASDV